MGQNCSEYCPRIEEYKAQAADLPIDQFDAGLHFLNELSETCPGATRSIDILPPVVECHSLDEIMMTKVAGFVISYARK